MKRLILLFILSFGVNNFIFCQESYRIEFYNLNYRINKGVKNNTDSRIQVKVHYKNGTDETLYYRDIRGRGDQEVNYKITPIERSNRPIKISCFAFVNFRTGTDANDTKNIIINSPCEEGFFDGDYSPRMTNVSFNYKVLPFLNIAEPNNDLIGFEDNFDVSVESNSIGFPSEFYNWQYQAIGSGVPIESGWENMPSSTNGQSSFSIKPSSFLTTADIGKRLYIRIKTCNDLVSENAIFYRLTISAPHIISVNTQKTICFDEDNGTAVFNFDRDLYPNEKLSIDIYTDDDNESEANIENKISNKSYTKNELPPGNYEAKLLGFEVPAYEGQTWNTYVESPTHKTTFTISEPTPVEFSYTKVNVWCNEGSDGQITITAKGGVPDDESSAFYEYKIIDTNPSINGDHSKDWTQFSQSKTHTIVGLPKDTYNVQVRDSNGCIAKEIDIDGNGEMVSGDIIEEPIEITQPENPVAVVFVYHEEPTAFGFSNGLIRAQVTGGTPLSSGKYNYTWTHENGTVWETFSDEVVSDQGWFLTLENAIAGTYTLTVTDAYYTNATNKTGCTIDNAQFILEEPAVLELSVAETTPISCNNTNAFNNPWNDGELTATATGGVPLDPSQNNGLDYYYIWKKETSPGVWTTLTNQINPVATGLDVGNYAVNIIDANGITVGTATNNIVTPVDVLYNLTQPELLQVTLTKEDIFCSSGNDGSATVAITGGIPPYDIQWSNGQNEATAVNLIAGNHVVYVTDYRGCLASGNITIEQPGGLEITVIEQQNPSCFEGSNGSIELAVSGGVPPYSYSWNTGATTTSIAQLPQGTYIFTLKDVNNCTAFKEVVLEHPDKITIDLGEDRTLCKDQTHDLDGSITDPNATYLWSSDNGFSATTPKITVSEEGIYTVVATSSLGCIASDSVTVSYNDTAIDSEFLLSSQAYVNQEVVLFNISDPLGEYYEWLVPNEVTIVSQEENAIKLLFPEVKTYKIGLTSIQGDCYQESYKNIVVEEATGLTNPGDTETPFIKAFEITPNPNNGQFELYVELAESSPISIRIFTIQGSFVFSQPNEKAAVEYTMPIDLNLPSGVYFIILESAKETQVRRMIVN